MPKSLHCACALALYFSPSLAFAAGAVVVTVPPNLDFPYSTGASSFEPAVVTRFTQQPVFSVRYVEARSGDTLIITPQVPYLDFLAQGKTVASVSPDWSPFSWLAPKMSIKITNTTGQTLYFDEAAFSIDHSEIDTTPVPYFDSQKGANEFDIVNEGWGKMLNASLDMGVLEERGCNNLKSHTVSVTRLSLGTIIGGKNIVPTGPAIDKLKREAAEASKTSNRIARLPWFAPDGTPWREPLNFSVPPGYVQHLSISDRAAQRSIKNAPSEVCMAGYLNYQDERGKKNRIPFTVPVLLQNPPGRTPGPPSAFYSLQLEAGKQNYTVRLPISQVLKPGESDNFIVDINSEKSADFQFRLNLHATDNTVVDLGKVDLHFFRPRSARDGLDLSQYQDLERKYFAIPELTGFVWNMKICCRSSHPGAKDSANLIVNVSEKFLLLGQDRQGEVLSILKDSLRPLNLGEAKISLAVTGTENHGDFTINW